MNLFPFYEDISGKTFLVAGGGSVARRKVAVLMRFTDRITVVAEETDITEVPVIKKRFEKADLDLGDYVVAATGNPAADEEIARLCREAGKKVNVVDQPALCSFIFPAVLKRGPLVVSVSTSGASPAYAGMLKERVAEMLPGNIEEILLRMEKLRALVPELLSRQEDRAALYRAVLLEELSGHAVTEKEARSMAEKTASGPHPTRFP